MRVNLQRLLADRNIVHPSSVEEVTLRHDELRVRLRGFAWWDPGADRRCDRRIELIFGGVGEGCLDPRDVISEHDECLETFTVTESSRATWADAEGTAIFCGTPLPRPLDLYFVVHDFLARAGAFRSVAHFLNGAAESRGYLKIVGSAGYCLGRFPQELREAVTAELRAQGVTYTEHPAGFERVEGLLVRIQSSWFFCATAEAEFEA